MKYYSVIELKDFKSVNRIGYLSGIDNIDDPDNIKITITKKIETALHFEHVSFLPTYVTINGKKESKMIGDILSAIAANFGIKATITDVIDYEE